MFRRVAKTSFCKEGTTWLMWFPLCYWAKFSSVDISCELSNKQSQSTANIRIWKALALAEKISDVLKSCKILVLQSGNHMAGVVLPLVFSRIFKCGYPLRIEWEPIGIDGKQKYLEGSGLGWQDLGSFEELQNARFAEGGPHGPCGAPFAIGPNFQVWISPANRVANDWNQHERGRFGSLWVWLTTLENFRRVAESSFCKGGSTWLMWSFLWNGLEKGDHTQFVVKINNYNN